MRTSQEKTNTSSTKANHEATPQFETENLATIADNRPEVATQKQIKQMANKAANLDVVQRIKIGSDTVETLTNLAAKLKLEKPATLERFNAAISPLPAINEGTLNNYLASKKTKVRGGNAATPDQFLGKLAHSYTNTYVSRQGDFESNLDGAKEEEDYSTLGDLDYFDGEDDGAEITDVYSKALACTLFAILELKPGFLGAGNPKELHHILRSSPKTKKYDDDEMVAQIRIAAGLTLHVPAPEHNTVHKFKNTRTEDQRGTSYILDPTAAHTFTLKYSGDNWKQFDNDHEAGIVPGDSGLRAYWTV